MYHRLLLGFSDVGYYFNRLQNTLRYGDFLVYHSFMPTFYDHFCPGLAVLLPAFWIEPSIYCFILIQSLFVGLPGIIFFIIAEREKLPSGCGVLLSLAYFFYPPVSQLTYNYSYGFHPPTLALPFMIWSLYLLNSGKKYRAILPALIAVSMEEHISIYFFGWGICLIGQRKYLQGSLWMITSSCYFLFLFLFFFPWHTGGQNVHVLYWQSLGTTIPEIALSPFTNPQAFGGLLGQGHNWHLMALLFIPLLLLPFFSPRYVIALIPVFLFNFLRHDYQAKSIAFQYQVGCMGILFLGMVATLTRFFQDDNRPLIRESVIEKFIRSRWGCHSAMAILMGIAAIGIYASFYLSLYPWSKPNIGIIPPAEKLLMNARGFDAIL
jgi:uncharacterized membrane protein